MEEGIFCTHSRTSLADHGYMFASDVYRPHYRHIKMERLSNLKKKKKKKRASGSDSPKSTQERRQGEQ